MTTTIANPPRLAMPRRVGEIRPKTRLTLPRGFGSESRRSKLPSDSAVPIEHPSSQPPTSVACTSPTSISLPGAGVDRCDLPGMLMGHFGLEQRFGFHIGGLLGDGFVNAGALTLDFGAMRLMLRV